MSKNLSPKGRKLKNLSDPTLIHPHESGAVVNFMLTSVDPKWGRYLYGQYRRYGLVLNQSLKFYKKTIKTLNECRSLEIEEKTNFRDVPDKLRDCLEINSIQFLILTKLGLEYLFVEYQLAIKQIKEFRKEEYTPPLDSDDLGTRLKSLKDAIGLEIPIPEDIYTILDRRDIVEHPTIDRLWNGSGTGWKTVNLSWALCGEIEGTAEKVVFFVNEFVKKIEDYIKNNPIPGTLTGLTRGLKAGEQYKKPISK